MARTSLKLLLAFGALALPLSAAGQMPPMPTPGPAHDILKADVGTWDAVVETFGAPDGSAMTSKGVEVNTLGCNGLCLVSDFKGEAMPGQPFHGHGTTTYDPSKKKYVGSWTDSMSAGMMLSEGTWDPAAKKIAGTLEGPDITGKVVKFRSVSELKTPDTRVMTMYGPGPDGKETMIMRITYTRRK